MRGGRWRSDTAVQLQPLTQDVKLAQKYYCLEWKGPYCLWPEESNPLPWVIEATDGHTPGLYIWTLETDSGNAVSYVGITAQDIANRHDEHLRNYLSGKYSIRGAKVAELLDIKNGKGDYLPERDGLREFLLKHDKLSSILISQLKLYRIYTASVPAGTSKADLERIESVMIESLRKVPDGALENFRISRAVPDAARDIDVQWTGLPVLRGLTVPFKA